MSTAHYAVPEPIPTADTASLRRKTLDIAYAHLSPAQKLDVYLPEREGGPFPVILSIHGGAFMGGDKGDIQILPMLSGLERGYAVVSINYRMSGEARFPALVHDARAALRWVRANASVFGFDPVRIAAWGGSAGGYLAAMLGVAEGQALLDDPSLGSADYPANVQAVVDWFGPTDFLSMDAELTESGMAPDPRFAHSGPNSPESLLLGAQITLVPELVRAANPETYVRSGLPPFLLQHGTADDTVPYQQSVHFAARLRAAMGSEQVELDLLEGARHADPVFGSPRNLDRVFSFLDRQLR